jgi:uncharacterized protein YfiM (DUF2279 family)
MTRKTMFAAAACITFSAGAHAADSVNSELSHALAGALMAGASTAVADRYCPEHRALIGFTVSASLGVLGEAYQSATGGKFSLLDAASNAAGAAIGSIVTDKLILVPVTRRGEHGGAYYGVVSQIRF